MLRAFREGVRIQQMGPRMLGHSQARRMGTELIRAADEAKKRGAPAVLME